MRRADTHTRSNALLVARGEAACAATSRRRRGAAESRADATHGSGGGYIQRRRLKHHWARRTCAGQDKTDRRQSAPRTPTCTASRHRSRSCTHSEGKAGAAPCHRFVGVPNARSTHARHARRAGAAIRRRHARRAERVSRTHTHNPYVNNHGNGRTCTRTHTHARGLREPDSLHVKNVVGDGTQNDGIDSGSGGVHGESDGDEAARNLCCAARLRREAGIECPCSCGLRGRSGQDESVQPAPIPHV